MNTTTAQIIQLIFILILFVGLFAYLGLNALVRYWRSSSAEELKVNQKKLREFQARLQQNRQILQVYSPQDPEPFGPLAVDLNHQISRGDRQLQALFRQYTAIQLQIRSLDSDDLRVLLSLPWSWWKIRGLLEKFAASIDQAAEVFQEANSLSQKLDNQSQEISNRARSMLQNLEHSLQIHDQLSGRKIKDPILDADNQTLLQWQARLREELPAVFLSNDPAVLASKTDKQMVTDVFFLLNEAGPEIESMQVERQKNLADVEWLAQNAQQIFQDYQNISKQYRDLEARSDHPLILDQSRPVLDELSQLTAPVKTLEAVKALKQLEADVRQTEEAQKLLSQLAQAYQHTESLYQDILSLWNIPEIAQGRSWLRSALKLTTHIQEYDLENWPTSSGIAALPNDLRELMNQQSRLVPSKSITPIQESELAPLHEELLHLQAAHKVIRPRFQNIQERYIEVQQIERSIQDPLIRSQALLAQAASIIASNSFLTKSAGRESQKLSEALEKTLMELEDRKHGLMDKKARKASNLMRQIDEAAQKWCTTLENDLISIQNTLQDKLAEVEHIGTLDEAVILEARNLLIQNKAPVNVLSQTSEIDFPLAKLILNLKQTSEKWQRSVAAGKALEDVTGPLISRYQKAAEYRQKATDQLARAMQLIPDRKDWPPTNQVLTSEQNQFKQLEDTWLNLSRERISAMQYLAQLGNLSDQYQALSNQITQIADRAEEDVKRIQEAERRLEDSIKLWRHQVTKNQGNLFVRDGVEELLNKNNNDFGLLKKRYQRGSLPYSQILSQLRLLARSLDDALVPIDANQSIDINGVVQRNRGF